MNRNVDFKIKSFDGEEEKGVFVGLANKRWFKDHAKDVTTDSAFTKSIALHKTNNTLPKLLLQHDYKQVVGVFLDMWEDESGLWVKGQLCLDTELGRETYALMKMGALGDLSIGYRVIKEKHDPSSNTNFLEEVHVREVSLVTFPCNEESKIVEVKSDETDETEVIVTEEVSVDSINSDEEVKEVELISTDETVLNNDIENEVETESTDSTELELITPDVMEKLNNLVLSIKLSSIL